MVHECGIYVTIAVLFWDYNLSPNDKLAFPASGAV
jgi:hypothetical protein